jgi:hypothetical protein
MFSMFPYKTQSVSFLQPGVFKRAVMPHSPITRIGQLAHFFPAKRQYRLIDQLVDIDKWPLTIGHYNWW